MERHGFSFFSLWWWCGARNVVAEGFNLFNLVTQRFVRPGQALGKFVLAVGFQQPVQRSKSFEFQGMLLELFLEVFDCLTKGYKFHALQIKPFVLALHLALQSSN
jgi:hypothetical protein